jgi:hypothetical protein
MKQENRFVAQLFHFLAPFVDMERDLFICVDGGAAKHHAGREGARLTDPNVPDLWFTLCGQSQYTGIEAKVLDKNSISIRQGQLQAWRSSGSGVYRPHFWVATNTELTEFLCWHHATLAPRFDDTGGSTDNVKLSVKEYPPDHRSKSVAELALFILTSHRNEA